MVAFAFTACNKTKAVEENAEDVYEKVSLADLFTDAEDSIRVTLGCLTMTLSRHVSGK